MTATILKLSTPLTVAPAGNYIERLGDLAAEMEKDVQAFKQALDTAQERGLVPGQWVYSETAGLGLIVGYNDSDFSIFPAHEFPLKVLYPWAELEVRLDDVSLFTGVCQALELSESRYDIVAKQAEQGWSITRGGEEPVDLSTVNVFLPR